MYRIICIAIIFFLQSILFASDRCSVFFLRQTGEIASQVRLRILHLLIGREESFTIEQYEAGLFHIC